MKVMPVTSYVYTGMFKQPDQEQIIEQSKKDKPMDINPSFKYYMTTCQPIKPQISFTGHWPTYYVTLDDPNSMMFPLTKLPKPDTLKTGLLNYLA